MGEADEHTKTGKEPVREKKVEKKKILLRLDPTLHEQLRLWAERDFRSLNAHIEFLLKKTIHKEKE